MKIINKTKWETTHLTKFVREVIRHAPANLKEKYKKRGYPKNLTVTFVYNRAGKDSSYVTGCAHYYSRHIKVKVGGHRIDKYDLASTIQHELAHTLGYTHEDMGFRKNGLYWWGGEEFYPWAKDLPLEHKQKKLKPKGADLKLVRLDGLLKRESQWETKLKRAQNALKKIKTQKRYYEKSLAAMGVPHEK